MYRPLPKSLTIKESEVDGLGLFAAEDILKDTDLGISHVYNKAFLDCYIRTPLGGFFNHSSDPNCEAIKAPATIFLRTLKDIKVGEELTVKYWLYDL